MSSRLIKNRLIASMLGGAVSGPIALAILWLLWPQQVAPIPPVAVGLTVVLGAAGGAFAALVVIDKMRSRRNLRA